jgi:hypothetical protein
MLMEVFKFPSRELAMQFTHAVRATADKCTSPITKDGITMVTVFNDDAPTEDELVQAQIQWAGYASDIGPIPF